MSDDGDRTCPLCAEEMDLTDQQLKPCKCGYEICVWCWHHIMDMAEKDGAEGRCPACRTPYDKDRIVATAANCGRMVTEVKTGKKQKSQKAKVKTSVEARKHLTGVRVVQRNLVYIIGLPINLSDESLLERKEYFGQYGKVIKVSISRLTGVTAHHASNTNTFSVYITYSREEEAVRCIQAVHNFVLEGTTLSACFGTTKYCHAWLRNLTCGNPDCLYLHDVGSQEESFTKDEIISVYTRSRVQQIASTNLQRCSGNVLPPPVDDFSTCVTSNKTIPKSAANNAVSHVKASNYYAGKSTTDLPAAASWGARASNCQSPVGSITCSQTSIKQKDESADSVSVHSSAIAPKRASQFHDEDVIALSISEGNHEVQTNRLSRLLGPLKSGVSRVVSDTSSDSLQVEACVAGPSAWDDDIPIASSVPEERYTVHMNGARPVKPAESSAVGEFLISRLEASSMTPSSTNSSVISTNCSSIHSTSVHESNGDTVHRDGARTLEPARSNDVGDIGNCGLDAESRMTSYASPSLISVSCSAINEASAPGMETGVVFPGSNGNLVNGSHDILDRQCISFRPDEAPCNRTDDNGSIQALCSNMSSLNADGHLMVDHQDHNEHLVSTTNFSSADMAKNLASSFEQCSSENRFEDLRTVPCNQSSVLSSRHASRESSNWSSETQNQVHSSGNNTKGPLSTDDDKIHRISHVSNGASYSSYLNYPLNVASFINSFDSDVRREASSVNGDSQTTNVGRDMLQLREDSTSFTEHNSLSNFCKSRNVSELPQKKLNTEKVKSSSRYDGETNFDRSTSLDVPESSIISDILSLDFDPWDHALSSANDFSKLLGRTNKEDGSLFSTSRNSSIISQSRFSFARQDNQLNQSGLFREHPDTHKSFSLLHNSYGDNHPNVNEFRSPKSPYAVSRDPVVSSGGHAGLSRAKISAPPGFSSIDKAPPPGFSFQDKSEQTYAPAYSENILHTSLGNQYQVQESHTMDDVEFIDPAILAVGRGCMPLGVNNSSTMGPTFPSQFILKSDSRLQLLMQQSASSQQQSRIISDHMGDMILPPNEPYSVPRLPPQSFSSQSPLAHFSLQRPISSLTPSNHLGGWNNTQAFNEVGMLDMLRNERSGLNNYYYPRNDDYKFNVPTADLYNRSFGM